MARTLFMALTLVGVTSASAGAQAAFAQSRQDVADAVQAAVSTNVSALPRVIDLDQLPAPAPAPMSFAMRPDRPSPMMSSLYASTALMQGLDVHSTLRALDSGAVEANPLMSGIAKNRGAFIATKAALAATTILAAKSMAKRNKAAAIATLVAINSAYAIVVSHNYRVARGGR